MTTTATLCNHNDDRIQVAIEYYLERERGYHAITQVKILSPIPAGFICSDIQTDLEESIAQFENVSDVRLKCAAEYSERKKWSRIAEMNQKCTFLQVA